MRAARAARLFFLTRPIKFLIYGVVFAVPVVHAKTLLLFSRGRHGLVHKCVPHVQHACFSSLDQSNSQFVALSLPFPSSILKLPIIADLKRRIHFTNADAEYPFVQKNLARAYFKAGNFRVWLRWTETQLTDNS